MTEEKSKVIRAKNVGIAFLNRDEDDIKSKAFRFFSKKEKTNKKDKITWALQDITFEGNDGEILGIIGSNGAGKTTISKVITGILEEDRGAIEVDGKVTALFSYGMGLNPELTGRENIFLNGMMLGFTKKIINDYMEDIIEFAELGQFIDQPMKRYSSGMKARLGFSVASHLQPELLILDEALNTGDARFGKKAAEKLKELVKNAKMVIIVTHSLRYAQRNCDRLLWLENGKVRDAGNPKEIIQKYKATLPIAQPRKRSLQLNKTETNVLDKPVIKAHNLGLKFNLDKKTPFWANRGLNFEIKEGEVLGIIGHNGAGKSTLCKLMIGIYQPDEGELEVNGETSSLLGYGTGFNPQLTGEDNIYLNAMLLGIPKRRVREKYAEIVEFSGIGNAVYRAVKTYSSGMKSRLGFSIAAVLKPDVFIVDEALSTGDVAFQQKASERIQEMMEKAKAVIIVSHSMGFVEKVCTRAIWMEQGQIIDDGPAEEIVGKYREAMTGSNKKVVQKPVNMQKKTQ